MPNFLEKIMDEMTSPVAPKKKGPGVVSRALADFRNDLDLPLDVHIGVDDEGKRALFQTDGVVNKLSRGVENVVQRAVLDATLPVGVTARPDGKGGVELVRVSNPGGGMLGQLRDKTMAAIAPDISTVVASTASDLIYDLLSPTVNPEVMAARKSAISNGGRVAKESWEKSAGAREKAGTVVGTVAGWVGRKAWDGVKGVGEGVGRFVGGKLKKRVPENMRLSQYSEDEVIDGVVESIE
jgi:hypothetical protein